MLHVRLRLMAALFTQHLETANLAKQPGCESGQVFPLLESSTLNDVIDLHFLVWEPFEALGTLVLPPQPLVASLVWASCPYPRVIARFPTDRQLP